jgi:type VI secretion system protein ImpH
MAGEDRRPPHHLSERMSDSPWGFDFFEALRRLECSRPDLPRIGSSQRLAEDPVRLGQQPSLGFAPSSISGYEAREAGLPPRIYVAFMGLLGPNGPLPLHLTEYARDRMLNVKDPTLARFLDIFNHRMISFFYRAWATNQKAVHFERGPATWNSVAAAGKTRTSAAAEDRFIAFVFSTFGMGMPSMLERDGVPDIAKAWYSGRLACQTRHAEGLQSIIADYFKVPCRVIQFIGQWLDIPRDCLLKVGESRRTGLLGQSTIVGSRMWDCQQRFRIRLGPLTLEQYQRLLPAPPAYERREGEAAKGGASLRRLRAWVELYVGEERSWEVQLVLKKEEVPAAKLGGFGRLGWTTWLKTTPSSNDADDLVLAS